MVTMTGSSGLRWAALAGLAALAAADFLAQYVVAATSLVSVLRLPQATVDFLRVSSILSFDNVVLSNDGAINVCQLTHHATLTVHSALCDLQSCRSLM